MAGKEKTVRVGGAHVAFLTCCERPKVRFRGAFCDLSKQNSAAKTRFEFWLVRTIS